MLINRRSFRDSLLRYKWYINEWIGYSEKQGWNKIRIIRVHELRDQRTEFSWEDPFGLPVRGDRIRGQRPVKVLASTFYPLHFFVPCLSCSPFLLSLRLYSSSTLNSFHLSSPYLIWSFLIFLFFLFFSSSFLLHLCTFPIFFDACNFSTVLSFPPQYFFFLILSSCKFSILITDYSLFESIFYFQIFLRIF